MKVPKLPGIIFPLISLAIYSLGHGVLSTLVTVRLSAEGVSSTWIGFVSSAYFAGLIVGTFVNARLIVSVGHIRAFAAYASILAAITLLLGLVVIPEFWVFMRFLGGFASGGLLVVIESWILVTTPSVKRGQVMAAYMILFYGSMALGQMVLKNVDLNTLVPFAICAISASLSVVPLALARVNMPILEIGKNLPLRRLLRITPAGITSSFASGLLLGALYGLLPLFFASSGYDLGNTANMMAIVIVGGMALQYPIGRLSDLTDRRIVLAALFGISMVISIFFVWAAPTENFWLTAGFIFLLGGTMFSMYPISLSHACDEIEPNMVMSVNQGLLIAYSIGAMAGPAMAPLFIEVRGPLGLFAFFSVVCAATVVFLLYRRTRREAVPLGEHFSHAMTIPNTPIMAEIDPRAEFPEVTPVMPEYERRHPDFHPADDEQHHPHDDLDHPTRRRTDF
ncbi:MFS transporter [Allohahella sp. A8]|uniref:MFS transporter n=1 Tax=Allohahella sp. A8 TaxID=3141461 RepID=UPI003A80CC0A